MPQPAGPHDAEAFVGRSHELAVLSAALRQATTGDARLALVSGEPGIGKTELARAFARATRSDGALVLWGSAWEEGGAPPYWPWVQVLRSYGRQAGAAALAEAWHDTERASRLRAEKDFLVREVAAATGLGGSCSYSPPDHPG